MSSPTPLPVCKTCFIRGWREDPVHADRRSSSSVVSRFVRQLLSGTRRTQVRPSIAVGAALYRPGDRLTLRIGLEADGFDPQARVDIFVVGVLPDGQAQYARYDGRQVLLGAEVLPLLPENEVFSFAHLEVLHIPVHEWQLGAYRARIILTEPGQDPSVPENCLASSETSFQVEDRE